LPALALRTAAGREFPVTRGMITMPRVGAWYANLHLSGLEAPSGKVELRSGETVLRATVNRAAVEAGVTRVRVVAGGDGLRKPARPKHYTTPIVNLVMTDLARDAGETLASDLDPQVARLQLQAWTTLAVETGTAIAVLLDVAHLHRPLVDQQLGWRVRADGALWAGRESWPASPVLDFRIVEQSAEEAFLMLGVIAPEIVPGTVVAGVRADLVEHVITPGECKTKIWGSVA
jgi:hypothetical protein